MSVIGENSSSYITFFVVTVSIHNNFDTQPAFTCSKSIRETPEQCVKSV